MVEQADAREHLGRVFAVLGPVLDERTRRAVAAAEAQALGYGGVTLVSQVTGLARSTLRRGIVELGAPESAAPAERVRRQGGGRKRLVLHAPTLLADLEALVDPATRGDPESPLRWTSKSLVKLAGALRERGHRISARVVGELLKGLGYSLQGTRKMLEGTDHPDRDAQFEHINARAQAFQERGQPVISVDTKKKELVGDFKNGGREWQPAGKPEAVNVHDFPSQAVGHAIPYGVYDIGTNQGWVSVGTDQGYPHWGLRHCRVRGRNDSALVATDGCAYLPRRDRGAHHCRRWRQRAQPGRRSRLWKVALQRFADETGLCVTVCHFPPGTSKWNKIEHRLFAHITENWRGRPLVSHEVVVHLIGTTTTSTGLRVRAALDPGVYPTKQHVSDEALARVHLHPATFHGEWNYAILPMNVSQPGAVISS